MLPLCILFIALTHTTPQSLAFVNSTELILGWRAGLLLAIKCVCSITQLSDCSIDCTELYNKTGYFHPSYNDILPFSSS